ncbi:MAG TPA: hypothetical protein DCE73_12440 [Paraprevotella xylaniphila]|nr:hypothetical protein [Paraprevotella xylaniphila]
MKNRLAEIDFLFGACCFSDLLLEKFVNLYALTPGLSGLPRFRPSPCVSFPEWPVWPDSRWG